MPLRAYASDMRSRYRYAHAIGLYGCGSTVRTFFGYRDWARDLPNFETGPEPQPSDSETATVNFCMVRLKVFLAGTGRTYFSLFLSSFRLKFRGLMRVS